MKNYQNTQDSSGKIPYDTQPIYRQTSSKPPKRQERSAGGSKPLALLVCLLVVINVVLCCVCVKVSNKGSAPSQINNINITTTGGIDVASVAAKTRPSVVCVGASKGTSEVFYDTFFAMSSCGAGVIISGNKETGEFYVLTCYHVVKGYNTIYVLLSDSHVPVKATLETSYSVVYDLAVLKIVSDEYKNSSSIPCEVADSSLVCEGEKAIAYGNPQSMGLSVTSGEINSTINLIRYNGYYHRVMKTSAPINGGNSGGGLFNSKGELIGIVSAKALDDPANKNYIDNIAFAIPSNVAINIANNILKYSRPQKAQTGLTFAVENKNVVYDIVDGKLIEHQSIAIEKVEENSAGALAGFKTNDIVVSFSYQGKTVQMRNRFSLEDHIFNFAQGEIVEFKIIRGGEEKTLTLKVASIISADSQDWYNPQIA